MTTQYKVLLISTLLGAITLFSSVNAVENHAHDKSEKHHDKKKAINKTQNKRAHIDKHQDEHTDSHGDEHNSDENAEDHHEEGHIEITVENAHKAGIENGVGSGGEIKNSINVYGRVVIDANALSEVKARFSGLITKLKVNVGDEVSAGQFIAEVESSNSLKHYNINAPISGVVTNRYANAGELAQQQTLLTIENYDQLWVEYKIFPSQSQAVIKNQPVTVSSSLMSTQSKIVHLMATKNQPYLLARVPLNNTKALWAPGQLLTGEIVTSKTEVNLVVDNRAFQEIEGKNVIFVKNAGGYETRELQIGQSDGQFTQVISGLEVGEEYALINSYLLKADLGKAGASHNH